MGPLATTTAITAGITGLGLVAYNAAAPAHAGNGWGDLATFANDLVIGGSGAALAAASGLAALSAPLRPAARIGAGLGLGVLAGTAAGVAALAWAGHHHSRA